MPILDSNCTEGQPLVVSESHGFLASIVTDETKLGSADCPWSINVEPDQTVTVILHDFGVWRHNDSELERPSPVRIKLHFVIHFQTEVILQVQSQ